MKKSEFKEAVSLIFFNKCSCLRCKFRRVNKRLVVVMIFVFFALLSFFVFSPTTCIVVTDVNCYTVGISFSYESILWKNLNV